MKWVCTICGYVYDEEAGMPEAGIAAGTKWEDVPADWVCPLCGMGKDVFEPVAEEPEEAVAESEAAAPAEPDAPIHLTIDGTAVEAAGGSTVLEAAQAAGIAIPTLCKLAYASPTGACGMCTVELADGTTVRSCTAPAVEGMEITVNGDAAVAARKQSLAYIMDNHDYNCGACPEIGKCRLAQFAEEYQVFGAPFSVERLASVHRDETNLFFDYNPAKCIKCRRCVKTCSERQGAGIIDIVGAGADAHVAAKPAGADAPAIDSLWIDSACENCGNCQAACPTGALTTKAQRTYRQWEVSRVRTTCHNCGTGCQLDYLVRNGRIVDTEPADGDVNHGLMCIKGRWGYDYVGSEARLTTPLIKRDGVFHEASWDEALDEIENRMKAIRTESGPDAIGGFSSSRTTNEDNYVFQKMMRCGFGTNNVDQCARVCHSATVSGLAEAFGSGAMTNSIEDVENTDMLFLIGANPTEAHAVLGTGLRRAVARGAKLVVADPREIDLARRADVFMQVRPGTNVALVNAMMNCIFEESLEDAEFIANRTEGVEALKEVVSRYTPESVSGLCGVDAQTIREAARLYATAPTAAIVYCLGVTEHSSGTEGVLSVANLAMVCGNLGKPGCGVNPLRGQNNVQGACDMGAMPDKYPGYQMLAVPENREKFSKAWGVDLPEKQGLTLTDMICAAEDGSVRALYIMGENPAVTDPDIGHVRKALENLDFLVVQDIFLDETAALADVVLPATCAVEKEGTFTNTERRVQRVRKAVDAPGQARNDSAILCEVATRMGYPMEYKGAAAVMDEIAALTPSYGGISHARLDKQTVQWPCPAPDHPGTPILHVKGFARGERALFTPCEHKDAVELPDDSYPLTMTTGRVLYQYNCGNMLRHTPGIVDVNADSFIELNDADAKTNGVADGDRVRVSSRRGAVTVRAHVGSKIKQGAAWMPLHFPDGYGNELTIAALDDIARIPEYKVCAIKVERA